MRQETKALVTSDTKRTTAPIKSATTSRPKKSPPPLSAQQEDLINRYAPRARRGLRRLFRQNKRFSDLAVVFPAAAYALATTDLPIAKRRQTAKLVIEGQPLKHISKCLELPLWLRRLGPEAFQGDLLDIPGGESFSRRIVNRIPSGCEADASWLEAVRFGAKAANDDFALWISNQRIYAKYGEAEKMYATLAAYAWHSQGPRNRAQSLILIPWHPEIAFDTAVCAAKSWLNRLRLVMQLEKGVLKDPWFSKGEAHNFIFTPLLDHESLLNEARAMQNCADQYATLLARGRCRLFSIKRRGINVATMEIGPHPRETDILAITQLKGRHNMPASLSIWQAAHAWVSQQNGIKRSVKRTMRDLPFNLKTWEQLTADYRAQTHGAPWLPEKPTTLKFQQLEDALSELARRGGVRSWLFSID